MSLTGRQKAIVEVIRRYYRATGEPCPASSIARQLGLHHSTVQEHLVALHRKGLLRGPNPPAMLAARPTDPAKDAGSDPAKDAGSDPAKAAGPQETRGSGEA
jgi:SOS-response transcriptional repressor LexA